MAHGASDNFRSDLAVHQNADRLLFVATLRFSLSSFTSASFPDPLTLFFPPPGAAAKRAGIAVDTTSKGRSLNSAAARGPADYQHKAKLDADNEVKPPAKVDISVGQAIAKARQEKKDAEGKSMTQSQLATKINEKPQVVSFKT